MKQSQIIGKVDPVLKARIDWMQEYIDWLLARYDRLEDDLFKALIDKKMELVERV